VLHSPVAPPPARLACAEFLVMLLSHVGPAAAQVRARERERERARGERELVGSSERVARMREASERTRGGVWVPTLRCVDDTFHLSGGACASKIYAAACTPHIAQSTRELVPLTAVSLLLTPHRARASLAPPTHRLNPRRWTPGWTSCWVRRRCGRREAGCGRSWRRGERRCDAAR
jgi:hypothetical protein